MDKDKLFRPRFKTDTVDVDDVGTITVRGLTRWELLAAGKLADKGPLLMERAMIAFAFTALDGEEGTLTEADVEQWQKAGLAGEFTPVVQKINELSKVAKGSAKETYKSDGSEPGPGV